MMTSLVQQLRTRTWPAHREVEGTRFVRELLGGRLDRPRYCLLLASLHPIYAALEQALRRHAGLATLAAACAPTLQREAALTQDLIHLHGEDWSDTLPPQPAALDYAAHLATLERDAPQLLLAHAYVRYLGDLSGGQALRRVVARSLGLDGNDGTRFYDFGSDEATAALARDFRAALDRAPPGDGSDEAIVEEALAAFARHQRLFEQLAHASGIGAADAISRS
jgi:heme oxygenase (biliverdin-producing, ferredoxin)